MNRYSFGYQPRRIDPPIEQWRQEFVGNAVTVTKKHDVIKGASKDFTIERLDASDDIRIKLLANKASAYGMHLRILCDGEAIDRLDDYNGERLNVRLERKMFGGWKIARLIWG